MKTYELRKEKCINRPLREVFPFFERPENLAKITPPSLGFSVQTPSPIEMKAGAVIDYGIRVIGIPMRWRSLISAYEPPVMFVDEQVIGPYALWHHTHTFREENGATVIEDVVRYALPFGPLGWLAHRLFVRRRLEAIFAYRTNVIEAVFGA
jgi:ligand-binding SRPBCC domain-containing protein